MKLSIHEQKTLLADNDESQRRLSFCESCQYRVVHQEPICLKCACPIEFITTYEYQTCPIGVWK